MNVVIIGLGYVGLPLARTAAAAGLAVTGFDVNSRTVTQLNSGFSHIDDLTDEDIGVMLTHGFQATSDPLVMSQADVIVICVPTPLDKVGQPDLGAVISASKTIAANLTDGTTIVLESTTYPGTTTEILKTIFEQDGKVCGKDFFLAFSPERIDPGNEVFTLTNTPKIVGGVTSTCTQKTVDFYSRFIDTIVTTKTPREAETAKLLENTYRHVNIALMNEMAQFCHAMDIDIWDVIAAAKTKPFGFQSFTPSAGVGGHCIPIDPNYLAYKVRATLERPFRFIELAGEINQSMPPFVSRRIQDMLNTHSKPAKGSKVLLLGVTYKSNISDRRESPAVPLAKKLLDLGCQLSYHDPYVGDWSVEKVEITEEKDLAIACSRADAIVIVQAHSAFTENAEIITQSGTPVLDTTGKFSGENVERL